MPLKFRIQNFKWLLKTEKLVDSFEGFAEIIRYVSIFLKINFEDVVQKMPVEGTSDFRVTNNNILP